METYNLGQKKLEIKPPLPRTNDELSPQPKRAMQLFFYIIKIGGGGVVLIFLFILSNMVVSLGRSPVSK